MPAGIGGGHEGMSLASRPAATVQTVAADDAHGRLAWGVRAGQSGNTSTRTRMRSPGRCALRVW